MPREIYRVPCDQLSSRNRGKRSVWVFNISLQGTRPTVRWHGVESKILKTEKKNYKKKEEEEEEEVISISYTHKIYSNVPTSSN